MEICWATRPGFTGVERRCKRRQWGGTDYCYQHAISTGEAVVLSLSLLIGAVKRAGQTPADALAIWHQLAKSR